jgi:hypothetical protein
VAYPSAIMADGRPYRLPIKTADRIPLARQWRSFHATSG